jgi:hypothetical protein
MDISLCTLYPSPYTDWAVPAHLIEIYRSLYLFLAAVYPFSEDTLCLGPSLYCYREIPFSFGKHSVQYYVVPCECALLLWTIFSVYRDHISPLMDTLAYRLFEQVHHTMRVYTGYQQHCTRLCRVSITHMYTRYQQHYARVYRVSITHVYTGYH